MNRNVLKPALCLLFFAGSAFAQTNANLERGLKPFGTYSGGNVDTISMTSGNLFVRVPFWSYPQRGKLSWTSVIQYNNKAFHSKEMCDPTGEDCQTYLLPRIGSKMGVQVVRGEGLILKIDSVPLEGTPPGIEINVNLLSAITSDDSQHQMAETLTPNVYRSLDASGILDSSAVLMDRGGVRGGSTSLQDPNGNSLSTVDSLGRTPITTSTTTNYSDCTGPRPVTKADVWNMLVPSGGRVPVKLCWVSVHIKTNFGMTDHEFEGNRTFLQSIVLPNGTAWTFEYTDLPGGFNNGDLTKIVFPTGGSLSYTWTSVEYSRWVTSRTMDANDGSGSRTWSYSWAVPSAGHVMTDPLGNDTVYSVGVGSMYCGLYVVQTSYYAGTWNSGALLKTITTDYSWSYGPWLISGSDGCPINVVAIRATTTWPNGLQTKVETDYDSGFTFKDPDYRNSTTYTGLYGNVVQQREYAYGTGAPGALVRKTETAYLGLTNSNYRDNNLIDLPSSVTVRDGAGVQKALTNYAYDTLALQVSGVTTQFTTSPPNGTYRGNLTSVSRWLNTTGGNITSTTKYYDTGMVYQQIDPLNHTTTNEYSLTYHGAYPTRVTNHLGHQVNSAYDFSSGLPTSTTDPNNQTTTYTYDTLSRPDLIAAPDTGFVNFDFTDSAPFKVTITAKIDSTKNLVTEGEVDGFGRLRFTRQTSDPQGTVYTRTDYDALGRKQFEWNPTRCNITVGTPPGSCSGEDTYGKTETQYDALGRVTKVVPPDGTASINNVTITYSANSTTATDQAGKQRRSFTDALGRLIQVDEPNPTLSTPAVTTYTYDTLDNLLTVLQSGSRQRTFTYDSLSRLTQAVNPESGSICYGTAPGGVCQHNGYDSDGNLVTKTAPAPNQTNPAVTVTTTYGYDALHRLLSKTYSDGTTFSAYFTYDVTSVDGLSNLLNTVGRLAKAEAKQGATVKARTVNSYDVMGRIKDQWQCTPQNCGSGWYSAAYVYNQAGGVTSQSNPFGFTLNQGYDAAARLTTLTSSLNDAQHPGTLASGFSYFPSGAVQTMTYGNGLNQRVDMNNRLQLCRIRVTTGTTLMVPCADADPSGDFFQLKYGYNYGVSNNGNVMVWNASGQQNFGKTFDYDVLNRLDTMTWSQCNYDWHYDIWGNRLWQDATGGTGPCNEHFPASYNTKNQIVDTGIVYDAAGNLYQEPGKTYTYDAENRLLSVSGTSPGSYIYDADGKRVQKTANSVTTEFFYDASGSAAAEREGTNWTVGYVYMGGLLAQYKNGTTHFVHKDHLGTTRIVTSYNQSVVDNMDFLPFGEQVSGDTATTHKFTGKERDTESGLDNFGARYYSGLSGRFTSVDPYYMTEKRMNDPQRINLYAYARNNPLIFIDPDGKDVTAYTERLPTASAGYFGALPRPRHTFIVVSTRTRTVLIELGGPTKDTSPKGNPIMKDFTPDMNITNGRKDVEEVTVTRPENSPEGDFTFEEAIISGFEHIKNSLPDYNGFGPNSNGFIQFLIESSGGSIDLPFNAYYHDDTIPYAIPPSPQPPPPPQPQTNPPPPPRSGQQQPNPSQATPLLREVRVTSAYPNLGVPQRGKP